ncbi:serine hydrolase domain-containing protein [Dyadobacter beijingensis]|uniref:serine hydrolase domain-containing protein n=1 Tax=Dyadobacter beijingensis TaxID=365489 RepID=UPI0003744AA0|nr:serine hydrolase [Dyadobacter beijingensis]
MKRNKSAFLVIFITGLLISSCTVTRVIIYNFAGVTDHRKFPKRDVRSGPEKFVFQPPVNNAPPAGFTFPGTEGTFGQYLEAHKTVAFLIIRNDRIEYEKYFGSYDRESVIPSFSIAKSITSILIGCAIDDGLIGSVNDRVIKYVPELAANGFENVTVEHLLQMTSGIGFNEGYGNPFGDISTFYYGRNLRKAISKLKIVDEVGKKFEYQSGSAQVLGLVLERALKDETISHYLQDKIWVPLGMEFDASWSIDRRRNGLEKTFCCINVRARDLAKIGRLYLGNGDWNGKQIVSKGWVRQSTKVDTTNGSASNYQYQWWLPSSNGDFLAEGILGQLLYVNPSKNLIVVRLGSGDGGVDWKDFVQRLSVIY